MQVTGGKGIGWVNSTAKALSRREPSVPAGDPIGVTGLGPTEPGTEEVRGGRGQAHTTRGAMCHYVRDLHLT